MYKIRVKPVHAVSYCDFIEGQEFTTIQEAQNYMSMFLDYIDMQTKDYIIVPVGVKIDENSII